VESSSGWRRVLGVAVALVVLNASLTFESAWPTPGVRWRGLFSIELAVCVLAMAIVYGVAALRGARRALAPPGGLSWLAVLWTLLVVGRYGEITAAALYGREINLFWDLRFVPDVAAMLAAPSRLWMVALAAAGAVAVLIGLFMVFRWALRAVAIAAADPLGRRVAGTAAAAVLALWVGQRMGVSFAEDMAGFAPPASATYLRQARLLASSLLGSTTLGTSPPMDSDLSRVSGADVYLLFVEAYGAISYERPEFVARLAADRAALDAAIRETGREVVSAFVVSPTFGGSSWLAHITLLSGVEVRSHDANALLMRERRDTLVTDFKRHGYRTVAIMPGLWQEWPEGQFYGFDRIYGGQQLAYRGPEFGWWDMTDQFALARMDALEVSRQPRPPLFLFMPTISTHIPFTPTPPYQPDWRRVLTDEPYDEADVDKAYLQQPDWTDLGPAYAEALSYMYQSLSGYLRLQAGRDAVFVVIGDHQPAAAVSGEGAPWNVPVHVIASRPAVLERFLAHGFRTGITPAEPALGPMHGLTPVLLDAFGDRAAAAEKSTP
jgi:hypothetical protein